MINLCREEGTGSNWRFVLLKDHAFRTDVIPAVIVPEGESGYKDWRLISKCQAEAFGGEDLSPLFDESFVGMTDGADIAVEVDEAERVHFAAVVAKGGVPVDLVGQ